MTMTDPVADMLTRIRNASRARAEYVDVPQSGLKLELTRILKGQGFIEDFKVLELEPAGILRLFLKYTPEGAEVINGIKRVSTPGRRRYVGLKEIPRPLKGMGVAILTTPKGLMTDTQAREAKIGGEVLCYVW